MTQSTEYKLSLEQTRDSWINAYYLGQVEALREYEHEHFKVIFKKTGKVESQSTRYDQIQHAVTNGVWKPQKPDIEIEEFEYDDHNTQCLVLMKSANDQVIIQEVWVFKDSWKIIELTL